MKINIHTSSPALQTILKILGVLSCTALGTIFGATFLSLLFNLGALPTLSHYGLADNLGYLFWGAGLGAVVSLIVSLLALKKGKLILALIVVGILALVSVGTVVLLTSVLQVMSW